LKEWPGRVRARPGGAVSLAAKVGYNAVPMDRRQQARTLVVSALAEIEAELAAPRYQLCPTQLGACRDTLRTYLAALDDGALPPKRDRAEGLGRMIADSWPFDVPLGALVLRAERAWRNA
jgi:hypothetical protein